MARSPSGFRNPPCDCLSRFPRRACRCPSRRPGPRRDRRILLSRIAEQADFRSYQSFGSLDTQLISSIEGPQSPESSISILSHDNASSVTSTTADLEEQRHTSPPFVATPTSSEASFGYPPHQYTYPYTQDRFSPPNYPPHSLTWPVHGRGSQSLSPISPVDQPAHLLAGIDRITQSDDAARLSRQKVEFVSPQGPSPTQHQQYPKRPEPWTTQSLRQEDLMDWDQQLPHRPHIDTALSPTSSNEKGSRRNGPLTAEARKNANIVRQMGACRRCVYMKELCNGCNPCQNCQGKKGRKWKAGCMRQTLDALNDVLFPPPICNRHERSEVNKYIYNSAYFYLDRKPFKLELEMGLIGRPLEVIVKEIEVVDTSCSELQAFQTRSNGEGGFVEATTFWNPPIVIYARNIDSLVGKIRGQLRLWMDQVLKAQDVESQKRWPWPCFDHAAMDWEGEVADTIRDYYREDFASHAILRNAQCLLFFGYILDHGFLVRGDARQNLLAHLHSSPPAHMLKDMEINPETITRFIKMIVFPLVRELSKSVLSEIQAILHGMALGKDTATARTDLAFCLTFIMLVFLAQGQNRILMLAELAKSESGINLGVQEAEGYINDMEHTLGSYMIHFHEFAVKRRKSTTRPPHEVDAEEQHARDKNLMGKVGELFSEYSHTKPDTVELQNLDINVFDMQNTHRLCWKFVSLLLER